MSAASFEPGLIGFVAAQLLGDPNPVHSKSNEARYGAHGSLSVKLNDNIFYDYESNQGGGLLDFIVYQGQAKDRREAGAWLEKSGFITPSKIIQKKSPRASSQALGTPVATYDYQDAAGKLVMQVLRYKPKTFRQRRPLDSGWIFNIKGVKPVPYHLPELLGSSKDEPVFIVEGEKDVDRMLAIKALATCNAGGAGKWQDEHSAYLKGRDVILLADNDEAGRKHVLDVAEKLKGVAKSIVTLHLPGLPEKGDLSDWLDSGGTMKELMTLVEQARSSAIKQVGQMKLVNTTTSGGNAEAPSCSELDLSDRLAAESRDRLRWTPGIGWMCNMGSHWEKDDSLKRFTAAKEICKNAAAATIDDKLAIKVCSAGTHSAMLSLARSSDSIVTGIMEWDANSLLLNTPSGVVDLATGQDVSRNGLLFTQIAGTSPSQMPTPVWDKFISEVFDNNLEMVEFMQRMGGYSLTGSIKEQKLFFLHGNGANGKSVFLDVLRSLGGTYSHNLPSEALMTSRHESHPTMLASLHGKRLAVSSEIEESTHWAESRIKSLTGDETMTARYMRQDFFTFRVTHKHIIAGNFKPRLKGDDFAMIRRIVLVPFTQRFEGVRRDSNLPERLKAEYPGILAWFIEGARKWLESGLAIPNAIIDASKDYMNEQNDIELWAQSCCDQVPGHQELSSHLFTSFDAWKTRNGEHAGSEKTFSQRLERAYTKKRVKYGKVFVGLRLIATYVSKVNPYEAASRGA